MSTYQRVLFAADLTDEVHHIIKKLKKLVDLYGAQLIIIHVVEHLAAIAYSYMGTVNIEEQLLEEARAKMKKLAAELGVDDKHQYLEVGHPKTEILSLAKRLSVDLIIVGSHGRHGIATLLGSTTNAILHGSDCDVLTIRAVKI